MISVVSWGIGGSVVDAGHVGRAWLGQSRGGAVDLTALALANRLVGNHESAAGLETSGGLALTFGEPTMVAVAGAVADLQVTHGPPLGWGNPTVLPAGSTLRIGRLLDGARVYLSVRGGLRRDADRLAVGADPLTPAASQPASRAAMPSTLRVWPGPRLDWAAADTWSQLLGGTFTVTETSRVGLRLSGPTLHRARLDELPSEGMVEGAVQLPPDGNPIIMLADHPTTGGYPVIAVLDPAHLPAAAQAAVGALVRFSR